ncbi:MAG: hypothetical protein AAGA18_14490 [Verrucomicrobiota bacterium]
MKEFRVTSIQSFACGARACYRGLTLIELLVVLIILIGIGSILIPTLSSEVTVRGADGESREASEVVTLQTMRTIREALIGTSTTDLGYRRDLGTLPSRIGGLVENIDGELDFSPSTGRGWNGPYLQHEGIRYNAFIETGDDFPTTPAAIFNDPAMLDGWGKPILLQQPDTLNARLVSAGPNRILETDATDPTDFDRGDDIIVFLLTADPNL